MFQRLLFVSLLSLGAAAASSALAAPDGATVFQQRCAVCHSIAPGPGKLGPPLKGVVGRKAGTLPGYSYSPAMQKAGFAWTPAQLDKFLAAPAKVTPGTKMMLALSDPAMRQAVIGYLGTQK
jgi:cytochrome c